MLHKLGISNNQFPDPYKTPQFSGGLLIVGSARCVWDDVSKVPGEVKRDVLCINDMIMHFPYKMDHAYSNDHRMVGNWVKARRPRLNKDFRVHCCNEAKDAVVWPFPGHGSSGLNACYLGLALGYTDILLCGVPLSNEGHYFDPPWMMTNFEKEVPPREEGPRYWNKEILQGVKSMSGRTKEYLNV